MSRIPLFDPSTASDEDKKVYDKFPSNLVAGLMRTTTELTDAYLGYGGAFPNSPLDPQIREMVTLRVGVISHSDYEWMQHADKARSVGVTEDEISAIQSGDFSSLSDAKQKAMALTDDLVANPKAGPTFEAVVEALDEQSAAIITLLVGHYMMTARFLMTLEIPLDDKPTSWDGA